MFSDDNEKALLTKYETLVENSLFKELFKKARKAGCGDMIGI